VGCSQPTIPALASTARSKARSPVHLPRKPFWWP